MHRPSEDVRSERAEPNRNLTLVEAGRGALSQPIPGPERGRKTTIAAATFGLAVFAGLSALVRMHWLVGMDLAAAQATRSLTVPLLDGWVEISDLLASAEFSMVCAAIAVLLLWRSGLGPWSLAPLAFLVPTVVELAMKLFLRQPLMSPGLQPLVAYPLIVVRLDGSFPSGHAIRSAFLCTFGAVLLWRRGGVLARSAAVGLPVVALMVDFARVYAGEHWLSDVLGGFLLGAAVALLVAPPVASRLSARGPR